MYFHAYQGSVPASSNILISLANLQRYPDSLLSAMVVDWRRMEFLWWTPAKNYLWQIQWQPNVDPNHFGRD